MCASLPIYPSKLSKVASLETKFRSLSSLCRIVCLPTCQSRDSRYSEWIHMCYISVAILDKSPLQGVILLWLESPLQGGNFEVGG